MRRSFTKLLTAGAVAAATIIGVGAVASAGATTPSTCSTRWGSLPESGNAATTGTVRNVRAGRHTCFDRLVIDVAGPIAGYDVRYVSEVTMDGSGESVPLRGGAFLQIVVRAPSYDEAGNATFSPANNAEAVRVRNFRTFRQVATAGSFEGQSNLGLGVRARLPFRVMTLAGPGTGSRLVIDVAHRW